MEEMAALQPMVVQLVVVSAGLPFLIPVIQITRMEEMGVLHCQEAMLVVVRA